MLHSVYIECNWFINNISLVDELIVANVQRNLTNMCDNYNHFKPILF